MDLKDQEQGHLNQDPFINFNFRPIVVSITYLRNSFNINKVTIQTM